MLNMFNFKLKVCQQNGLLNLELKNDVTVQCVVMYFEAVCGKKFI